jgi:hypothetical protein
MGFAGIVKNSSHFGWEKVAWIDSYHHLAIGGSTTLFLIPVASPLNTTPVQLR